MGGPGGERAAYNEGLNETTLLTDLQAYAKRMGVATGNGVLLGIGDDCALFRQPGAREDLLFTVDQMHEEVHFTWDTPPAVVGHNALARSLSDIAASGGRPLFCLVSLALPEGGLDWMDGFYQGLLQLARKHQVVLAGGDLARTAKPSCDVMVCGSVARGKAMARAAGKAGETIYVTGPLGAAALALAQRKAKKITPRLDWVEKLHKHGVRCAMDLSDGLSTDLARMATASGLAAEITDVPLSAGADLEMGLHGGEDYQLLFTSKRPVAGAKAVGRFVKGTPGQLLWQGRPLTPRGWDHFAPR